MKRIALIAHDNLKSSMVEWCRTNIAKLEKCELSATGTTKSGPLGGDQQIGAGIAEGKIDAVIFFWDPLAPHPHDVDVKALLRIAAVYNVPMACNLATANLIIHGL